MTLNIRPLVLVIAALATGVSGPSFAQNDLDTRADEALRREIRPLQRPPHAQPQRPPQYQQQRPPQYQQQRPGRGDPYHRDDRARYERDRYDRPGRGAGPDHSYYRGGRLPPQYRGYEYVVDDWRGHRLQAPPRGYHWVQTGADYVLVAIATGIIASIILNQ